MLRHILWKKKIWINCIITMYYLHYYRYLSELLVRHFKNFYFLKTEDLNWFALLKIYNNLHSKEFLALIFNHSQSKYHTYFFLEIRTVTLMPCQVLFTSSIAGSTMFVTSPSYTPRTTCCITRVSIPSLCTFMRTTTIYYITNAI